MTYVPLVAAIVAAPAEGILASGVYPGDRACFTPKGLLVPIFVG